MHEPSTTARLVLRWVEVTERGRTRLEMRWSEPAAPAAPAVATATAPVSLRAVTHAA